MPSNLYGFFRHKTCGSEDCLKLLNFEQKSRRMDITQKMLMTLNNDPDLRKKVVAGDQSWVFGYDIETKAQSWQWKSPEEQKPKKACQVRSNVKGSVHCFL